MMKNQTREKKKSSFYSPTLSTTPYFFCVRQLARDMRQTLTTEAVNGIQDVSHTTTTTTPVAVYRGDGHIMNKTIRIRVSISFFLSREAKQQPASSVLVWIAFNMLMTGLRLKEGGMQGLSCLCAVWGCVCFDARGISHIPATALHTPCFTTTRKNRENVHDCISVLRS